MATPLRLPAHADIHEFGVMYTKSVKKKAKDWHDGYLKWHTFNYRAILYDDQRKPVANEFFPNRTISSNSDLEFSNAIVQIGDQTETMQANLDHVYRTTAHKPSPLKDSPMQTASFSGLGPRTLQVTTPCQPRPLQKRIYPVIASHSRTLLISPTATSNTHEGSPTSRLHVTPVRQARPRSSLIGARHATPNSAKHVRYPITGDGAGSISTGPGWFARQDQTNQVAVVASKTSPERVPPKSTRAKKPRDASVDSASDTTNRAVAKPLRKSKAKSQLSKATPTTRQTSPIVVEEIAASCVPEESSRVGTNEAALPLPQPLQTIRKNSKLDPTRTGVEPRRRELLSAKRYRINSSETVGTNTPSSGLRRSSSPKQNLVCTHASGEKATSISVENSGEAIYDIDSLRWVPDVTTKTTTTTKQNQQTNREFSQSNTELVEGSALHQSLLNSVSQQVEDNPHLVQDYEHNAGVLARTISMADSIEDDVTKHNSLSPVDDHIVPLPVQCDALFPCPRISADEDGFIALQPIDIQHKKRSSPAEKNANRRAKRLQTLVEQYPVNSTAHSDNLNGTNQERLSVPEVPLDPLFLPDFGASQDNGNVEDPGVMTQLATKAAKDIAKRSSINKIVPKVPRKGLTSIKVSKTNEKIKEKKCRPAEQEITSLNKVIAATSPPSVAIQQHTPQSTFPPTPVELQTADLDAIFDDGDQNLNEPSIVEPKDPTVDKENNYKDSVSPGPLKINRTTDAPVAEVTIAKANNCKISTDEPNFKVATQIHRRAPDFMSAKSFQSGAKLQLDKPIAAVGMTAREIAAMDLATQLSAGHSSLGAQLSMSQ